MKKLKVLIASMIGAIALVFACVFSFGVNAAGTEITGGVSFEYTELIKSSAGEICKSGDNKVTITLNSGKTENKSAYSTTIGGTKYSNGAALNNGSMTIETTESANIVVYSYLNSTGRTITVGNHYHACTDSKEKGAFTDTIYGTKSITITATGGGGVGIYKIVVEYSNDTHVTPYQQEATSRDSEGYLHVRFIFVVSGVSMSDAGDLTNKLTLRLDDGVKTVTVTPNVVNKITSSGETYKPSVGTNDYYVFDGSTGDFYVIYVVGCSTNYIGHTMNASFEFGGKSYSTTPYSFTE